MAKIEEWKEQDVLIFFLPPYSPELNLIKILWRRIKYQWIPFDAYLCFQNLKERLSFVLNNVGKQYDIIFRYYLTMDMIHNFSLSSRLIVPFCYIDFKHIRPLSSIANFA